MVRGCDIRLHHMWNESIYLAGEKNKCNQFTASSNPILMKFLSFVVHHGNDPTYIRNIDLRA